MFLTKDILHQDITNRKKDLKVTQNKEVYQREENSFKKQPL
jgi:hypothetical protein